MLEIRLHGAGHNMGLFHDRGSEDECTYNDGLYQYGYRDPNGAFRTIMAYNCRTDECDGNKSNNCPRIQRFSTTTESIGVKKLGESYANAARWLNDSSRIVQNYFDISSLPSSWPSYAPNTPSERPTNFSSHNPSALVLVSFSAPSQHPTIKCIDNASFTFSLDNGNVQDCSWLTKNLTRREARIKRYCVRGPVKGACQKSCDFCHCEDDPSYTFTLQNGVEQNCKWLTRNTDRTDLRRRRYCYEKDGISASTTGDACVFSCGFCF